MGELPPHPQFPGIVLEGTPQLADVIEAHPKLIGSLEKHDPIQAVSICASLLGAEQLQSNCIRLEVLVHLCLMFGNGNRIPKASDVQSWFRELETGPCGLLEDPAEDVFVSNVSTPYGNTLVLEGIWESGGYYLQRLLDCLFSHERPERLTPFAKSILALLSLSDAFCQRSDLVRWQFGARQPKEKLPGQILGRVRKLGARARFSFADLSELGIALADLDPFFFGPHQADDLQRQGIAHTDLERYPLIATENDIVLTLPTAVTAAIRRFAFELLEETLGEGWLAEHLGDHFERHFEQMPWLGERIPGRMEFQRPQGRRVLSAAIEVDAGRYLNPIFLMDDLEEFQDTGLVGWSPNSDSDGQVISEGIDLAYAGVSSRPGFESMITVVVCCGLGRVTKADIPGDTRDSHYIVSMGAADFALLSQSGRFKALSLWRLMENQAALAHKGIQLLNVNGFLNLLAWSDKFEGNLVPQPFLKGPTEQQNLIVMVEQNAIRDLRGKLASQLDLHRVQTIHGEWKPVMRTGTSLFERDNRLQNYHGVGSDDVSEYLQVFQSDLLDWWSKVETTGSGDIPHDWLFGWYEILKTWVPKIAPVLDQKLTTPPFAALLISIRFDSDIEYTSEKRTALTYSEALAHLDARTEGQEITIDVLPGFERAIGADTNIAERALVQMIVEHFGQMAKVDLSDADIEQILGEIIQSPLARQSHRFSSDDFRDRMRHVTGTNVIHVDPLDAGDLQVGLGWRVRTPEDGSRIDGVAPCRDFLRALERSLVDEIRDIMRTLDREAVISLLMLNHERAAVDRSQWQRTAAAIEALRADDPNARSTIVQQHFDLNGVFQASRILIEVAVCEAPLSGGRQPGRLDISRLMTRVQTAMHYSGAADAIHYGAMSPEIDIFSVGGVQMNYEFHKGILIQHASELTNSLIDSGIEKHASEYAGFPLNEEEEDFSADAGLKAFEPEFLYAFETEYGVSFDEARIMVDYLEDLALISGMPVLKRTLSELTAVDTDGGKVAPVKAKRLVERWSLRARSDWYALEHGVQNTDLRIGQFRRRYGMLARPLIQITNEEDPLYMLSPGMVREAFAYQIRHLHQGDYRSDYFVSKEMRAWKSHQDGLRGEKFEQEVEAVFIDAEWSVRRGLTLNEILGQKLDRDFGDIDILAWNTNTGVIRILECKNIAFRQAPGELAEQLKRFQGEIDENGKRDLLRKHLDRVERLKASKDKLFTFCDLSAGILEHAIVFKNPVPMSYAEARISKKTDVIVFHELKDGLKIN